MDQQLLIYLRNCQRSTEGMEAKARRIAKAKTKYERIIRGKRRQALIHTLIDGMRNWRDSPFELEAIVTANLRRTLCLQGLSWGHSDNEATGLVIEAFGVMGVTRPSWEQGQREHVVAGEDCAWCGLTVPKTLVDGVRVVGFCSATCAERAFRFRNYRQTLEVSALARSALRIIERSRMPDCECEYCKGSFRPLREAKGQRFCSEECKYAAQRAREDQNCARCNKLFYPSEAGAIYCSRRCYLVTHKVPRQIRCCTECGISFIPKKIGAERCSVTCRNVYIIRTRKPKKSNVIALPRPAIITAAIFDSWFKKAA